ncbi:MAG TPA: MFS transporter [Rariglobus sp.]|nr:MFS transporter [Rariglobus sp.]
MSTPTTAPSAPSRPLSLGVIFLTLYIDLIGFSIIFPLVPDLLKHYLLADGDSGLLGWLLGHMNHLARALGNESHLPEVLFGGVISSLFSILQFIFAPFWGSLSDKHGRRSILLFTVAGTAFSYLLWVVSGSFWLFLVARLVAGAFGGNLSVATAAVADVTTRAERSKAMGIVGAAFGLGLVTGPLVGAFTARINLLEHYPSLAHWGINPFSVPALFSFGLGLVNLVWISRRFSETLPPEKRGVTRETRLRNPIRAILSLDNASVRSVNLVAFIYALAFVAMETSLVFVSAQRFNYTARENGMLMGFLGVCSIITQGFIVRKLLARATETRVLGFGLISSTAGLLFIGFCPSPGWLYAGVALLALGSGLVNPSTSGLISLYAGNDEQGRVLGIYRSLGSLARAITPIVAGVVFWTLGAKAVFIGGALLAAVAWLASTRLPQPAK